MRKGQTKYISSQDFEAIWFLYGLYQDHVEAGAWATDDERLSPEELKRNKEIHEMMSKFRKKFKV